MRVRVDSPGCIPFTKLFSHAGAGLPQLRGKGLLLARLCARGPRCVGLPGAVLVVARETDPHEAVKETRTRDNTSFQLS